MAKIPNTNQEWIDHIGVVNEANRRAAHIAGLKEALEIANRLECGGTSDWSAGWDAAADGIAVALTARIEAMEKDQ